MGCFLFLYILEMGEMLVKEVGVRSFKVSES